MAADYQNLRVAILEGRTARGMVDRVVALGGRPVLAPDADPAIVKRFAAGELDAALFNSPSHVADLLHAADHAGQTDALLAALRRVAIGSSDDATTAALTERGIAPDFEPDTPGIDALIDEFARLAAAFVATKRLAADQGIDTLAWRRTDMRWAGFDRTIADSVMMKAVRREPTPFTPVWLMRQAGRYQRAYRQIREKTTMLGLCKTPELAAEVTLMAVERLGVDAAIIFADILLPLEPMGFELEFAKGEGPIIHNPVRGGGDVGRVKPGDDDALGYVYDAIRTTRAALRPDVPLIGFCGSPFTVASYMIEGGKSKAFAATKTLMLNEPDAWHELMRRLTDLQTRYLRRQVEAGADLVQVFGSWDGSLSPDDYRAYVLPHVRSLIAGLNGAAPVINFATGNPALVPLLAEAGASVVGLDWRCDLADARASLGDRFAVMGNIDPVVLYSPPEVIRQRAMAVLDEAGERPGHIFNLGHGISPDMNPRHVASLVDAVHELSAKAEELTTEDTEATEKEAI